MAAEAQGRDYSIHGGQEAERDDAFPLLLSASLVPVGLLRIRAGFLL